MPSQRRDWLAAATLAGITFAAFWPALGCEFINYDDPDYVSRNPHVTAGISLDGVRWAFTSFECSNWHPLTWLSLQADAALFGPNPRGFHLTNVLLHCANAALAFLALRSLTGAYWRSLAAAVLFAVHPLRAESVAWVAERKDVLSVCFGLSALWAYAAYVHAPSAGRNAVVAGLFALSLLAKPSLVTLPCLFLVLDWWPLCRWREFGARALLPEKVPQFVLAAASCVVTVRAQASEGAVAGLAVFPLPARIANAVVSYGAYLCDTFWPARLAIYYPHPVYSAGADGGLAEVQVAGAVLLLTAVTAGAAALRRRAPYLLAGWLWFLGTLVPVIGIVQVGGLARADRYTYFSQLGVLLALCWGVADLAGSRVRLALAVASAAALALAVRTHDQLAYWHDSLAVWSHALELTRETPEGLVHLGEAYAHRGNDAEAARCYEKALRLDPTSVRAHNNLGNVLRRRGKLEEAERELRQACERDPTFALAHTNLGNVLSDQGKLEAAAREHEKAIELAPLLVEARTNLGQVEWARGNLARAADCYRQAIQLRPDFAEAYAGLGGVLLSQGRPEEAVAVLDEAVRRDPRAGRARLLLGMAREKLGDTESAARDLEQATRLSPDLALAWQKLGAVRTRQGRIGEAVQCYANAVEREPSSAGVRSALAAALDGLASSLALAGRYPEAATAARQARDAANAAGQTELAARYEERMQRYERRERPRE